jgi:hypothetical protein
MTSTRRQLTIRSDSVALLRRLKALAKARGESVNTTVLAILKKAVDFEDRRERLLEQATWTKEDVAEVDRAAAELRVVDDDQWR